MNDEKKNDQLAPRNTAQHGLSKFMNTPMLLGTPADVVPRALANMTPDERDVFDNLAADLQVQYPGLSNLQAAHMALASMMMDMAVGFARRRGLDGLDESAVAALEWARKVYNQNVTQALKDVERPPVETNWMRDLEEFEIERKRNADGSVEETIRGRRGMKLSAKDIKVIDVTAAPQVPENDQE